MRTSVRVILAAVSVLTVASCIGGVTNDSTEPAPVVAAPVAAPAVVETDTEAAAFQEWRDRTGPRFTAFADEMDVVSQRALAADFAGTDRALEAVRLTALELLADPCPVPSINEPLQASLRHQLRGVDQFQSGIATMNGDLIDAAGEEFQLAGPLMEQATIAVEEYDARL